jgi:hypothetical protein
MNINQIAMGAKPDPFKFTIIWKEIVNGNTIIVANYHGCLTFGGNKLMVLRGTPNIETCLDPHFLNEDYPVIARFPPTAEGRKLALLVCNNIETISEDKWCSCDGTVHKLGIGCS